jgi:hypothetical protein
MLIIFVFVRFSWICSFFPFTLLILEWKHLYSIILILFKKKIINRLLKTISIGRSSPTQSQQPEN